MINPLVIDNFFPDFNRVLTHARTSEFYDWLGPDGEVYKRVNLCRVPTLGDTLQRMVGNVEILGAGYRLNYKDELPNHLIHTDVGWGTHALVVYLNAPNSGTAFWKHKELGIESLDIPTVEVVEKLELDWEHPSKWEQTAFIEGKPNRAVIYNSSWFHSRFPFQAAGETPEDGRLVVVAFFNFR